MIRRAAAADAGALAELAAATFPLACPASAAPADIQSFIETNLSEASFADYLADETRAILVGGEFEGYTLLNFTDPTDMDVVVAIKNRPTAELSKCYVRADTHGSGLAAELMQTSLDLARARGAISVWLGVNQENAKANRFYEKQGFERVGTKRFKLGDRWEHDYVREVLL
jgi:ribosomal protein S18 acetylase RimI-like enzyme